MRDKDFGAPLADAKVSVVETGEETTSAEQGNFVLGDVPPGKYTLVFSKDGYLRHVEADVVVTAGQLTDVDVALPVQYTDMDEFVVQDVLAVGAGTEAALLALRFDSPALMDSVSSDLMSKAGASDAASALRLVSGATLKDGKSAVVRGLPDRYVSSQLNGVRIPTADEDKRAVELDQFPGSVLDSVRVTKTFTPDQQGDASGGAVDVRLKEIPDEGFVQLKSEISFNSQATGRSDFLTYKGGGVNFLGMDDGGRDPQLDKLGGNWDGAVGVSRGDAPVDYKWSLSMGRKTRLSRHWKIGGLATLFYERDSKFYDNGTNDSYWVENPGDPLTPRTNQGAASSGNFRTALFDITQGQQSVRWGGLGSIGLESEDNSIGLTYLYTRNTSDTATLAEDTRGKEYFFPGYDKDDSKGTGNEPANRLAAPYIRLETLDYVERTTTSLMLNGHHRLGPQGFGLGRSLRFRRPELSWTAARSSASYNEPDKRQFGSIWLPPSYNPGVPPFVDPFTTPPTHLPYKPGANFNLGNLQRIWKRIDEESTQGIVDLKLPFDQWGGERGYFKTGLYADRLDRKFNQDTYSNFGDEGASFEGGWEDFWSGHFPDEDHAITASNADDDYKGNLDVSAAYGMVDLPLSSSLDLITGARLEQTKVGIVNDPEAEAVWYPPDTGTLTTLNPGDADVDYTATNLLPSAALRYDPTEKVTLRAGYSETVARQTFKELTPIIQQEFQGGPIFIGNPSLTQSTLKNYDLRADYTPYDGALLSLSWFRKDIKDAIEYVQKVADFDYTTAENYPSGVLEGYELEARQELVNFWDGLEGFSAGANATFIDSEVRLPDDEIAAFSSPEIDTPMTSRDMTNAPDHLYNLFLTYDAPDTGTQIGLFYTVTGDTLLTGAGQANHNFVPSIYAKEYDTLNLTFQQRLGKYIDLKIQGKNLTNPSIETVYRSRYTGDDVRHSSFTTGFEVAVSLGIHFNL